jgi:hypothetical protein
MSKGRTVISKYDKMCILLLGTPYLVAAIAGIGNITFYPRQFFADIAPIINIFSAYIIVKIFIRSIEQVNMLVWVLLYAFGSRGIVGIVKLILNIGFKGYYYMVPFIDPVGVFEIFTIFVVLSFFIFIDKSELKKSTARFLVFLFLLSLAFMIMSPGRSTWLYFVGGLIFLSFITKFKQKITLLTRTFLLLCLLGGILFYLNPTLVTYSFNRLTTIKYIPQGANAPTTISQRPVEYINIFYKLKNEKALLWGGGAGSWFDDRYLAFPGRQEVEFRSFTEDQMSENRFFRPHGLLPFVFLKSGIFGIIAYLWFLLVFTKITIKEVKGMRNGYSRAFLAGLYVPIIYQLLGAYVSKNFVMCGILLGLFLNVLNMHKINMYNPAGHDYARSY